MGHVYNKQSQTGLRKKLRNNMPKAEIILWSKLKGKQMNGFKFRRQYGVGPYVIDFYCPKLKLAIEVDGDSHFKEGAEQYDQKRQKFIESYNIHFLRFANADVYENLEGVIDIILDEIGKLLINSSY